jgi:hypothetical protein
MRKAVSSGVCVPGWVKAMMYAVTLVLAAVGIIALAHASPMSTGARAVEVGFAFIMFLTSGWLFRRFYFLCSVVVTETGVEQSFLAIPRGFKRQIQLAWDDVVSVSFRDMSFHFLGKDGIKLELNVSLFQRYQEIIRRVHQLLPSRLRSQIQL